MDGLCEQTTSLLIVLEHVVARTGGTEQDNVPRDGKGAGELDRFIQRAGESNIDCAAAR